MFGMISTGLVEGSALAPLSEFDLGRGAIAGAFIVAAAFLAGFALMRRSGLAVCALLVVLGAGALELSWLGFFAAFPSNISVMILGLFAASAIVFLSASIGAARENALLGGVMFTAALVIAGMGFINFIDRVNIAGLMRWSVLGVGAFAACLALAQAARGDIGARLILPGLALAVIAPLVGPLGAVGGENFNLLPHALFSLGVLGASIIAMTERGAPMRISSKAEDFAVSHSAAAVEPPSQASAASAKRKKERAEIVLDSQIARVLDYAGVAVWDWSPELVDQTESLSELLGADSTAPFTPDALRNFIHKDDIARFEKDVLAPIDGPFDIALKLYDGRKVRLRGARAANETSGELERLVAFIETASPIFKPSQNSGVDRAKVQKATEAAIVPATRSLVVKNLAEALDKGEIVAAFQPIVSLKDDKIVGYEALARWPGQENIGGEGPETFAKAADIAGKGGALARTMLAQAAAFLAEKLKADKRRDLFVAMNVTWGQMREQAFAEAVAATVIKFGLPKNTLVLELTEGDAVTDDEEAGAVFTALKKSGAALAFDDFGAGFSCLSNLRKYDFDYLKIDKSFSVDLESNGDGAKIVGALSRLGGELGLTVIVEGVESKPAARAAAALGCAYAQGYALGEPEAAIYRPADANRAAPAAGSETPKFVKDEAPATNGAAAKCSLADQKPVAARWMFRRNRGFR